MTTEMRREVRSPLGHLPSATERLAADMPTGFRPDIEGLRAVAVLVVLLYHAHLGPTRGGFLGVDVFFVVSGYLITSLLMKDLLLRGGTALPAVLGPTRPATAARLAGPGDRHARSPARFILDPLKQVDVGHDAMWASAFIINIKFAMGRQLRRGADHPDATAALLVARGGGAVLHDLAVPRVRPSPA